MIVHIKQKSIVLTPIYKFVLSITQWATLIILMTMAVNLCNLAAMTNLTLLNWKIFNLFFVNLNDELFPVCYIYQMIFCIFYWSMQSFISPSFFPKQKLHVDNKRHQSNTSIITNVTQNNTGMYTDQGHNKPSKYQSSK